MGNIATDDIDTCKRCNDGLSSCPTLNQPEP